MKLFIPTTVLYFPGEKLTALLKPRPKTSGKPTLDFNIKSLLLPAVQTSNSLYPLAPACRSALGGVALSTTVIGGGDPNVGDALR